MSVHGEQRTPAFKNPRLFWGFFVFLPEQDDMGEDARFCFGNVNAGQEQPPTSSCGSDVAVVIKVSGKDVLQCLSC